MKSLPAVALASFLAAGASAAPTGAPKPLTDDQKTFYTLGYLLGRNVAQFGLSPAEFDLVKAGLSDSVTGKDAAVPVETYGPKVNALAQARAKVAAEKESAAGNAFLLKKATETGVQKLPSGVLHQVISEGTGPQPKPTDKVEVHYTGTLLDGTVFDSSVQRGQPATFPLTGVISCWTEGLQTMKVGGKTKLFCPSNTAYGERGSPPKIKPGATLVFDVELLKIVTP